MTYIVSGGALNSTHSPPDAHRYFTRLAESIVIDVLFKVGHARNI